MTSLRSTCTAGARLGGGSGARARHGAASGAGGAARDRGMAELSESRAWGRGDAGAWGHGDAGMEDAGQMSRTSTHPIPCQLRGQRRLEAAPALARAPALPAPGPGAPLAPEPGVASRGCPGSGYHALPRLCSGGSGRMVPRTSARAPTQRCPRARATSCHGPARRVLSVPPAALAPGAEWLPGASPAPRPCQR